MISKKEKNRRDCLRRKLWRINNQKEAHKKDKILRKKYKEIRKKCARDFYDRHRNEVWFRKKNAKRAALYYKRHRDRFRARTCVSYAVLSGKLAKSSCCEMCGKGGKIEAHHVDYDKPLLVIWLCFDHHRELHENLRRKRGGKNGA